MIAVGDRLPDGAFKVKNEDGSVSDLTVSELFDGQKVVLIGLPGAFTSTCHNSHMPQYISNIDALQRRGADRVAVLSVNDFHVMRAWAESLDGLGKVDFLADGTGEYTRAIGMEAVHGPLGARCKRFSALVEDRVVKTLNFEPEGQKGISTTGAAAMLTQL